MRPSSITAPTNWRRSTPISTALSQLVFGQRGGKPRRGPCRTTRNCEGCLAQIGRARQPGLEDQRPAARHVAHVAFRHHRSGADYLSPEEKAKFKSLSRDISSLNEYETRQTDHIQFLLDATLGLTNIEQNNIFRILTVVSIVGIPPTLVASMYGMNFKNMPELEWTYGYDMGARLILLSALIPMIWFKRRGWW